MKSEEVMIGDWVRLIKSKAPIKIEAMSPSGFLRYAANGNVAVPYSLEEAEPVPLTPEIFEKNGFEYICNHDAFCYYHYIDVQNCDMIDVYQDVYNNWFVSVSSVEQRRVVEIQISSVHELQHALKLCRIEKEIVL